MTRKEFDLIIDTVGEKTKKPCPESMKIIIWGKFKNWDAVNFARFILDDIENPTRINKHVNS